MRVRIFPSTVKGSVHIPPSKSMAHRAIICASLSKGKSHITNIDYSDDILATIEGMKALGATIETKDHEVIIEGVKDIKHPVSTKIDCHESGSTLRFFIPIFSLCDQEIKLSGTKRLMERPQSVYQEIFNNQNIQFTQKDSMIQINGSLKSGDYHVLGNISSQFISGLLFTLPLLTEDSYIYIKGPFESRSYVDLTIQMLKRFHVDVKFINETTIYIPGSQSFQSCDVMVEGDYSQLAFFGVLAAINNDLEIHGVDPNSLQGDKEILDILKRSGSAIEPLDDGYRIHKSHLNGTLINLENCPDIGPILCVLGIFSKGNTRIENAQRLRIKESDRIAAMEEELNKIGANISSSEDTIHIDGDHSLNANVIFSSHNDHRIVMSLAVASTCLSQPCIIENAQAINKSYPSFFEDFISIGGKVEYLND